MNLKASLAKIVPFRIPHSELKAKVFHTPAYQRVDIEMSRQPVDNKDKHINEGLGSNQRIKRSICCSRLSFISPN